jgi:hypothetical protein
MISLLFSSFLDLYLYGMYTVFALISFLENSFLTSMIMAHPDLCYLSRIS